MHQPSAIQKYPLGGSPERQAKEHQLRQRGQVVWLYGLSGAGKSTLAMGLERELMGEGRLVVVLDGDVLRRGLNRDLGFSDEERTENLRRVAEVAGILVRNGLIVLCAFITPLRRQRELIRSILGRDDLREFYLQADVATCARRDPKGLYRKARAGELQGLTGVGATFEEPGLGEDPLVLDTVRLTADECVRHLLADLRSRVALQA